MMWTREAVQEYLHLHGLVNNCEEKIGEQDVEFYTGRKIYDFELKAINFYREQLCKSMKEGK